MNKVRHILKSKGSQVWTVSQDVTVAEAVRVFTEHRVGSVLVMDGDKLVGIFTERDFAYKVGSAGLDPKKVNLSDVMTKELTTVSPSQSVNECMALMTDNHIRHLPVIDHGKLVGIVSIGDVVKDLIEELQFMVEQMEKYIQGLR
jgi:CBS domain-containing protein